MKIIRNGKWLKIAGLITIQKKLNKGISSISLLVSILILNMVILSISQWSSWQRQSGGKKFQSFQAMQLADNQKQRLLVGLECEKNIIQNGISFQVKCQNQQVEISFPLGKLIL